MARDVNWNVDEIRLKDNDDLPDLPASPTCPILVKLFLQVPDLIAIPPTFFVHMPVLKVLDLSNTNIGSLPTSISSLSSLREFFLRDCSALMELPTQIGMLSKLKLFDIEGTELMFIPKEMGKLKNLEVLRVSLSQYAKDYIKNNTFIEKVIPRKMISELRQLKELCIIISVGSEPEWWEEEVAYLQNELCDLEKLENLRWYLPTSKVLHQFLLLERNHVPLYADLSNLMLTIGQHAQLTSCLPQGLEEKFEAFGNCLKWLNAEGNTDDISKISARTEALFLSRHWTIEMLSNLNVTNLKYCLLAECNEMETLVKTDDLFEDVESRIENGENSGLELLQYLSVHHMKKLQGIWKGPIGEDSLSKLRILALHTCSQLTSIFTPTIVQNLLCLVELIVEDCPKVTSLISCDSNVNHGPIFPSLEKIFLLHLPELVNIFVGQTVLENLRTMLIYSCLQLRDLSNMELPQLKKIEGEIEWWKGLGYDKSRWENIFVPLKKRRDLVEQLFEATNSIEHFHNTPPQGNDENKSDSINIRGQLITVDTPMEKGQGIVFPSEETKDNESYGGSPNEAPDTRTRTNIFSYFREWVRLALSRQETEDDKSYGFSHSEAPDTVTETDLFYSIRELARHVLSRQETEDSESYGWSGPDAPDMSETGIFSSWRDFDHVSLSAQENDEKNSSNVTDTMEQVTPADNLREKGKGLFLPAEGSRTLEVAKPEWEDTLWNAMIEGESLTNTYPERMTKSETLEVNVDGGNSTRLPPVLSKLIHVWSRRHKKQSVLASRHHMSWEPFPLPTKQSQFDGSAKLGKELSLSDEDFSQRVEEFADESVGHVNKLSNKLSSEEFNQRVEAFIKKCKEDLYKTAKAQTK